MNDKMVEHTENLESLDLRDAVGIVVFNREGRILVGKRSKNKKIATGFWQFPQGGIKIKKGESVQQAAKRELWEEVGLNLDDLILEKQLPEPICYKYITERTGHQGQRMHWVLYYWKREDNILAHCKLDNQEAPEFSKLKMKTWKKLMKNAVPFKVDMFNKLEIAFKPDIEKFLSSQH